MRFEFIQLWSCPLSCACAALLFRLFRRGHHFTVNTAYENMADTARKRFRAHEENEEENGVVEIVPSKKPKTQYKQKFKADYRKDFPAITSSRKGESFAFCTLCKSDFTIAHSGRFDIKRHTESKSHKAFNESGWSKTASIATFFSKPDGAGDNLRLEHETTRAEAMICHFIAESNLPLATADKQ